MFERLREEYKTGLRGSSGIQIEDEGAAVDKLMMSGWFGIFTGLVVWAVGRGGARFAATKPETNGNKMIGGLSRGVAAAGVATFVIGAGFIGIGSEAQKIIEEVNRERGYLV